MKLGFAMCGSFCTFSHALTVLEKLAASNEVYPIMSFNAYSLDTRFGTAGSWRERVEMLTGKTIIHTIEEAEKFAQNPLDVLIILPCTGNTLAKIANGITDTPVVMAYKAHARINRPTVLAIATNDGLSANLKNIASLLSRKNVYITPFGQDAPASKPYSLVADFGRIEETVKNALEKIQIQPILISK